MSSYHKFDHDQHARQFSRQEFWSQIRRTVNGSPVDEAQINLILKAIQTNLEIHPSDCLLDIGCGNGALSSLIATVPTQLVGIDNSEYLISVAKEFFEDEPRMAFHCNEVKQFLRLQEVDTALKFTKAICYGAFSYLSSENIDDLFQCVSAKSLNVSNIYIGNIPDRSRVNNFFVNSKPTDLNLDSHESSIGKWWNQVDLAILADQYEWNIDFYQMPKVFYGSMYRFDALLTRNH